MFNIHIGSPFFKEKKYIVETLFSEFIGVEEYHIVASKNKDYQITHSDSTTVIVINDCFFSNIEGSYMRSKYLPKGFQSIDMGRDSISFPFGNDKLIIENSGVYCGADIFASAFFMLTRWEEVVEVEKDQFDRFPEEKSWVVKNDLVHRPLVNEYAAFLLSLFQRCKIKVKQKPRKFEPLISHDIDSLARYDSLIKIVRAIGGDIFRRKSIRSLIRTFADILGIYVLGCKDNYDTIDYLMNISEKSRIISRFYFIPGLLGEYDVRYNYNSKKANRAYEEIKSRKHIIGIHPSYNSYIDKKMLIKEKNRLEEVTGLSIKEGRQHYLRFQVPETWQYWEDIGLEIDGSMGFEKFIGFRTGSCYRYSVFNVKTREKLKLKEDTLHVMDIAIVDNDLNPSIIFKQVKSVIEVTKKYEGNFSLLWHNNNLFHPDFYKYVNMYERLIEELNM